MAWKEYYVYGITFTDLASGDGTVFTPGNIRIDPDSQFEFVKTMFHPITSRVRVRYRDDTNGRYLMKGSQDIRTIGGHTHFSMAPGAPTPPGFVPYIWPRPYLIPPATTFSVEVADFSGLETTLRMAFHGSKIKDGRAPWDKQYRAMVPHVYPISDTSPHTVTIAANDAVPATVPIDNDSHFLVQKITGARTGALTVTIKDGARDRQWMNTSIHFDNLVGNGHFPNILPSPRFVARGSVIALTLSDLSGASNTVELNFHGVKLYE